MKTRRKDSDQYIKFLAIIDTIQKYSDEQHPITIHDIKNYLYKQNYSYQIDFRLIKKYISFYNDYYNDDIIRIEKQGRALSFYYTNPYLDAIEAKAIVDLVYSSDFFTLKTKENYKERMQDLFSIYHQNDFHKHLNLHISKNEDAQVFYQELEIITQAIQTQKEIQFQYIKPTIKKENTDKTYQLAPIDTIFSNNEYYLVCQGKKDSKDCILFRLDYIKHVKIIIDSSVSFTDEELMYFNKKINNTSYMYGQGKLEMIELSFQEDLYTNIIDKFGKDIKPKQINDNTYSVRVYHIINSTFYAWIIGFGGGIQIIGNKDQIQRFKQFLQNTYL